MSSVPTVHSSEQPRLSETTAQDAASDRMRPLHGKLQMDHTLLFQEDGDVIIEIENYKLLVSREKLSSVSVVFAAMFNGCFREGEKITFGDLQVHHVLLPDDDIDSVLLLCTIIYERDDLIEGVPNAQSMLSLAVLCDKYQCAGELTRELKELIFDSLFNSDQKDTGNLCVLLAVSYITNHAFEFFLISTKILDTFRQQALKEKERHSFYQSLHHPLIRVDFACAFETKFNDINQGIDRMFSKPFQRLRECCCGGHPNTRVKRAGSFMEQLFKVELMPKDISKVSFNKITTRVENLEEVPCHHFRSCNARSESLKKMVREEMHAIYARGIGICLDCVKSNNRTALAGQCRRPHTTA